MVRYNRNRDLFKMEGVGSGGKGGFEFIKLDGIVKAVGTPEPALRFLIALLIGNVLFTMVLYYLSSQFF